MTPDCWPCSTYVPQVRFKAELCSAVTEGLQAAGARVTVNGPEHLRTHPTAVEYLLVPEEVPF
jgi:hypothetical protein